jgi:hypothetical protein
MKHIDDMHLIPLIVGHFMNLAKMRRRRRRRKSIFRVRYCKHEVTF